MKRRLSFIWIIMILLASNIAYAGDTDILVNLVRQETDKVKNALTIQIDTRFNELSQQTTDNVNQLEENVNQSIDEKMRWQLIKFSIGGFFSFLLAMLVSRFLILRQERKNPFYIDYKNKQQELNQSKALYKSKSDIKTEELKLKSVKEKIQPPKQPPQQRRTFTREEVIRLMDKQKQELSKPKEPEVSDLDRLYKGMN